MRKLISTRSKITAFVIGCLFGSTLYGLYLWLGKDGDCYSWLASDDVFVSTFGQIFFPVQYVIFSFGDYWTFSDTATTVTCLCLVALLYGYIFLSLRLFPKLAIGTFMGSIIIFLFSLVAFSDSNNPIFVILFWQIIKLHVFVVAVNVPTGPCLIAGYCCVIGFWYAAAVCGLRILIKYPTIPAKDDGTKLVPGWFVGECKNTTVGVSANLLLIIHGADNAGFYGELCLSGELGGGGDFRGLFDGSELTFSTCVPTDQVSIQWRGQMIGEQIRGTYIATTSHPDIVQAGQQSQQGSWSCTFVRENTPADPARVNEVYVYNQGAAEGPFTREQFCHFVNQDRWPTHAIAASEDRTLWTNIANYREMRAADETTRN